MLSLREILLLHISLIEHLLNVENTIFDEKNLLVINLKQSLIGLQRFTYVYKNYS